MFYKQRGTDWLVYLDYSDHWSHCNVLHILSDGDLNLVLACDTNVSMKGMTEDLGFVTIKFPWRPLKVIVLWPSPTPPLHWQLIGSQFSIVSPSYSVGNDWSPLITLLPYIVTSFVFSLIYSIVPVSVCEHTNRLFISVQFRSFLLSGKTGKTFIWISPKVHRFWNWN